MSTPGQQVIRGRLVDHLIGLSKAIIKYQDDDQAGKSHVEIREAIGDKFPKHIYHSIICIGALIAHWQYDSQAARSTQMSQKK
jgi:hypothetical protein